MHVHSGHDHGVRVWSVSGFGFELLDTGQARILGPTVGLTALAC